MKLSERQRLSLLLLLLIATLAAASVPRAESEEEPAVAPAVRKDAPLPQAAGASQPSQTRLARLDTSIINREAVEKIEVDIFLPKSWQPPPPPPVKAEAAPPPKPVAPPLPFRYAGQLGDPATGKIIVYLSTQEHTYTVTPGETIEEHYRLESIGESQLTFVYLPLNTQQFLAIPAR